MNLWKKLNQITVPSNAFLKSLCVFLFMLVYVSAGLYIPEHACQGQKITLAHKLLWFSCLCPPICRKSTGIIEIRSTMLEFYVSSGIETQVFMLAWQVHLAHSIEHHCALSEIWVFLSVSGIICSTVCLSVSFYRSSRSCCRKFLPLFPLSACLSHSIPAAVAVAENAHLSSH